MKTKLFLKKKEKHIIKLDLFQHLERKRKMKQQNQKHPKRSRWGCSLSYYRLNYYGLEFEFDSVIKLRSFKIKCNKELTKFKKNNKIDLSEEFVIAVAQSIAKKLYKGK